MLIDSEVTCGRMCDSHISFIRFCMEIALFNDNSLWIISTISCRSSSEGSDPSFRTTKAVGASPTSSFGTPITATSLRNEWNLKAFSSWRCFSKEIISQERCLPDVLYMGDEVVFEFTGSDLVVQAFDHLFQTLHNEHGTSLVNVATVSCGETISVIIHE